VGTASKILLRPLNINFLRRRSSILHQEQVQRNLPPPAYLDDTNRTAKYEIKRKTKFWKTYETMERLFCKILTCFSRPKSETDDDDDDGGGDENK
jgi:hypothetical protein